ncbi:MAG: hypothetical protein ACRCSI_13430, partial [Eubacterium aggregans]
MALIIDETFTAGIPSGFASTRTNTGSLAVAYNSAQQAVDLTPSTTNANTSWVLDTFTTGSPEIEVEIDMEFVSGTDSFFGVYFFSSSSDPLNASCLYFAASPLSVGVGTFSTANNGMDGFNHADRDVGIVGHIPIGTRKTY